jgi:hypothetical protein
MAFTFMAGVGGIVRGLVAGDSTTASMRIRGFRLCHTAAATCAIVAGASGTSVACFIRARTTTNQLTYSEYFPDDYPFVCQNGFKVLSITSGASLQLFV